MTYPAPSVPLVCLRLQQTKTITASADSVVTKKVPFPMRILEIRAGVEGIDDATDVDLDIENGTTDLCDPLPVADSSAIVAGGVVDTPDSGQEDLAAGDVLHLDIDITGGSSPDVDGCWIELWGHRLPE